MTAVIFYISAATATVATAMVISSRNAVHALLHLIVSLLAIAVIFTLYGAPFAAALEVIVYAGAIMVLMIFVIMMLNQGDAAVDQEKAWLAPKNWYGPALLTAILLVQLLLLIFSGAEESAQRIHYIGPTEVGIALFSHYILAVELASMLLLAGLVGAFHLARHKRIETPEAPDAD
ncbi:NADH-quinone oxidoreductase subunit J [Microbulbifer thermotolerans]|uniref:NADH-quinone oxidoreductase subunit J n=1 Tax=Microbulbifer thermotolerans TaxID=252514 RepID=A0A143HNJ7_MICTH|nr:NADH-quinone oxidoreductase subunit J [Microbulbifer thermotolerans]AMX03067.1 NADH dehydrogenase [Microbulbifer thermotolerans]MCX2779035.1 NADH-quinone oxidoreductase subunit J [Microbulbifer thermotolerans]MCX2804667.1 NADH-quinone oxidoreductase subunit J [Microbulbifer thermotolerans]